MKKTLLLILVQILICTIIYAGGIVPPRQDPDNPELVKGEILVKFKDDVELQISSNRGILETGINSLDNLSKKWQVSEMEKVFKNEEKRTETKTIMTYTGEIIEIPQLFNIYKMKIPDDTDIEKAVEDFEKNPNVEYAEPNYIARICVIPDDPSFSNQWGLNNTGQYHLADADIDAPEAWEIETGDSTVIIGIIDTGVDWGHPDLADKMVSTGYDFVNNDDDAMDDNGHGSHVAGIAAATTNNALGIAGVAWNCKILPVKVLQSNGYGTYSDVASGVNYAANNNAKVINLSLGGYTESYTLRDALENAYTTSVIVAAAGNGGTSALFYPAAWSFVIGVGASDVLYDLYTQTWYEGKAVFSNYGINADLYAPGVNIYSTIPLFHPHTYSYAYWNGTSMSAPFVTGTVALLRSHYSDWSNELIHGQLINTTYPIVGGNRLNTHSTLIEVVEPQLSLYSHTIIDTIAGCDQDGIADAGETVEMVFDIQNTWGQAYNVEAILSYHSYEDTCFVNIIDSISTFGGGVSPYAHVNNETNPYKFYVKSSTPNNTDVYFDYEITCDGGYSFTGTFYITTQRGIEIGGIIWSDETWTNDYLYIVTSNTLVDEGVTLTIEPGTRIQSDSEKYIRIDGTLIARGTSDSMIVFTSNSQTARWGGIYFSPNCVDAQFDMNSNYVSGSILEYAEIERADGVVEVLSYTGGGITIYGCSPFISNNYIHHNVLRDGSTMGGGIYLCGSSSWIKGNLIKSNHAYHYGGGIMVRNSEGDTIKIEYNVIEDNTSYQGGGIFNGYTGGTIYLSHNVIRGNRATTNYTDATGGLRLYSGSGLVFCNNISYNIPSGVYAVDLIPITSNTIFMNHCGIMRANDATFNNILANRLPKEGNTSYDIYLISGENVDAQHNYWGTTNTDSIDTWIWDYYDDFSLGKVFYQPYDSLPVVDAPGFLYQVEFNPPPPIGCEVDTFNLIFSKPMDISIQPYVTFGVCEPYTQHIIEGVWVDSTNWQGTYTFGIMTGDGINHLRVTTAQDCEGMEIPKDTRFSFVVDATGASSVGFIAQAGIGKVDLEWNGQDMVDLMGYNMYRYHKVTDSTYSDTTLVNTSMITDTTYCDMSVEPYVTYYYMYTGISTDFIESDYSDPASATPFDAEPGDANGDMAVNVLDITTIVAYMLNQNPQPFLFDAADVNNDETINVLDIIGVVNIILGRKEIQIVSNDSDMEIGIAKEGILLKSEGNVAGLQFDLYGKNINEIKLTCDMDGFDLSYKVVRDHIIGVLYSLNGENIPSGVHKLLSIEGGKDLSLDNIIAGNSKGDLLNVKINNDLQITPVKFAIYQNYPNPFKNNTTIKYALAKKSRVEISVYNIRGQLVRKYKQGEQEAGFYDVVWNGKDDNGRIVGNGIYLYKIKADIIDGGTYSKVRKILLIK